MRDLHDGAQQRLVALRVKITLATERGAGSDGLATAHQARHGDLDLAIAELRDLARGLLLTVGRAQQLGPALRIVDPALADGCPRP